MERRMEKASIYLWDLTSFKDIFICDISSTTLLNSCLNLGVTRTTGCVKPGLIWWFRGPTYIYLPFLEFRFLSCLTPFSNFLYDLQWNPVPHNTPSPSDFSLYLQLILMPLFPFLTVFQPHWPFILHKELCVSFMVRWSWGKEGHF